MALKEEDQVPVALLLANFLHKPPHPPLFMKLRSGFE